MIREMQHSKATTVRCDWKSLNVDLFLKKGAPYSTTNGQVLAGVTNMSGRAREVRFLRENVAGRSPAKRWTYSTNKESSIAEETIIAMASRASASAASAAVRKHSSVEDAAHGRGIIAEKRAKQAEKREKLKEAISDVTASAVETMQQMKEASREKRPLSNKNTNTRDRKKRKNNKKAPKASATPMRVSVSPPKKKRIVPNKDEELLNELTMHGTKLLHKPIIVDKNKLNIPYSTCKYKFAGENVEEMDGLRKLMVLKGYPNGHKLTIEEKDRLETWIRYAHVTPKEIFGDGISKYEELSEEEIESILRNEYGLKEEEGVYSNEKQVLGSLQDVRDEIRGHGLSEAVFGLSEAVLGRNKVRASVQANIRIWVLRSHAPLPTYREHMTNGFSSNGSANEQGRHPRATQSRSRPAPNCFAAATASPRVASTAPRSEEILPASFANQDERSNGPPSMARAVDPPAPSPTTYDATPRKTSRTEEDDRKPAAIPTLPHELREQQSDAEVEKLAQMLTLERLSKAWNSELKRFCSLANPNVSAYQHAVQRRQGLTNLLQETQQHVEEALGLLQGLDNRNSSTATGQIEGSRGGHDSAKSRA